MENVHFSSKTDMWATPQDLFDSLNSEHGFTLDVCAVPENAKCARFFTPEDDGLIQDWKDHICWMNPPYGKSRPLFPFIQLKRAHFIISILSKFKDAWVKPLPLPNSNSVIINEVSSNDSLFFFDNEKWKNFIQNNNGLFTGNDPLPGNPFIELSGIFSSNCANTKNSDELLNSGLMNHFNLNIEAIDRRPISPARGTGLTLMDAYAALAINKSGSPYNTDIIFHDLIIRYISGYIKDCRKAIPGIDAWVKKAYEATFMDWQHTGAKVVCLLPARTDTAWWHDYAMKGEITFLRGRLKFGGHKNSAPFPSAIVVFNQNCGELEAAFQATTQSDIGAGDVK